MAKISREMTILTLLMMGWVMTTQDRRRRIKNLKH